MKKLVLSFTLLLGLSTTAAAQQTILRVNCGGPIYTDTKGQTWQADFGFNTGNASTSSATVTGTSDPVLYQTDRVDPPSGGPLIYRFPVENGQYHVNLYFAETASKYQKVGARVFNVSIENILTFNLDIFAAVGANRALVDSAEVWVRDGELDIELDRVVGTPKINAIEILPAVPAGAPRLTLNFVHPDGSPVSGTLAFSATSSLINLQGSTPLVNGQVAAYLLDLPSALGLSQQYQITLTLTDNAGKTLWQFSLGLNPTAVNFGGVSNTVLTVVIQP